MTNCLGQVHTHENAWSVYLWDSKSPPDYAYSESRIGVDTETEALISGEPVKPVIMQVAYPDIRRIDIVWAAHAREYLKQVDQYNPTMRYIFHSAPFDLFALDWRQDPALYKAFTEGRIIDIYLRYLLRILANGTHRDGMSSLAQMTKALLGITLAKDSDLRLSFKQNQPLTQEQIIYAALDPAVTVLCGDEMPEPYPTEDLQLKGAMALRQIELNGMLVDKPYFHMMQQNLKAKAKGLQEYLDVFGWRLGEKRNSQRVQEILGAYESWYDLHIPRTPKSRAISTKEEHLQNAFGEHQLPPFLRYYLDFAHTNSMLGNYLSDEYIGVDDRAHPSFSPLMKTGRVSCSKPNLENLPKGDEEFMQGSEVVKLGIRGIYIAPPDHCLAAVDIKQAELCALAQHCWTNYGQSRMRELINDKQDLHYWFGDIMKTVFDESGSVLPSKVLDKCAYTAKEKGCTLEEVVREEFRQRAKAANFGQSLFFSCDGVGYTNPNTGGETCCARIAA